jgi:hypothetical protein
MSKLVLSSILPCVLEFMRKNEVAGAVFVKLITQNSPLSLRILDWLVTQYSRRRPCVYMHNGKAVNIHLLYKANLRAYSKKAFDPFCRRERIYLTSNFEVSDTGLETTVGQMNFFRWAWQNGVIDFCAKNINEIEIDLRNYTKSKPNSQKHIQRYSVNISQSISF